MTRIPYKILFLDIDGVLQTASLDDWAELEFVDKLIELLQSHPDVGIVLTTTDLEHIPLASIVEPLPHSVRSRIVGALPITTHVRSTGGKQRAIEQWLSENPVVKTWAAVDDEPYMFKEGCPWLVQTHRWIGWDEFTTCDLDALLRGEAPSIRREVSIGGHYRQKPGPDAPEFGHEMPAGPSAARPKGLSLFEKVRKFFQ